ncbi:MAG: cytochrome c oxidase assembly protein, partial [Phycisphaerales bacterium]|nr:cytochrome c oxidase assembly protein [Phycisphaerales bacterium]
MTPVVQAMLTSWDFNPLLWLPLVILGLIYLRGWRHLHARVPDQFHRRHLACYLTGLFTTWLAIASPLDAVGSLLFSVHMSQHLLLMMVAPPLVLLGAPGLPLMMGLPESIRRAWLGPFLAWGPFRSFFRTIVHPAVGWTLFVAATVMWHIPEFYEVGLRNPTWHVIEHATFLLTSTLFWWPVVQPYPSRPHWPRWTMIPYLLAADLFNTLFSAFFCFYESPIYATYVNAPRITSLDVMQDQAAAGALMWVPGSIIFLVPVAFILRKQLSPQLVRPDAVAHLDNLVAQCDGGISLPILEAPRGSASPSTTGVQTAPDTHRGMVLHSLAFRRTIQCVLLALAVIVVDDGLLGPDSGPMNLAGVLPWTHWRGLVVLALLLAGNLFCFACPFMLPREIGKRLFRPTRNWPTFLRSKWLAVALLLIFLWSYEILSLWDSPWMTAWIIIGYFAAAFTIDSFFRGASFCKYVCPIGQFHFVQSMVSPREVRVRNTTTCDTCRTKDCIRGNETTGARGCELDLYQPRKSGNMDCTFCLDCVRACPHDNVDLLAVTPGADLIRDPVRSSIGRLSTRWDLCALVAVLVFGGFANALGMVGPVLDEQLIWQKQLGHGSLLPIATYSFLACAVLAPLVLLPCAGWLARICSSSTATFTTVTIRGTLCLIPIGFAMWLVHMLFHFFTSWATAWPASQRMLQDLGSQLLGEPAWAMS